LNLAFGDKLGDVGPPPRPVKDRRRGPGGKHLGALGFSGFALSCSSHGFSHFLISIQALSLTALCIGTIVFISLSSLEYPFRFIASKNIFSEGYIHLPFALVPLSISLFAGVLPAVLEVRGMLDITRSVPKDGEAWEGASGDGDAQKLRRENMLELLGENLGGCVGGRSWLRDPESQELGEAVLGVFIGNGVLV